MKRTLALALVSMAAATTALAAPKPPPTIVLQPSDFAPAAKVTIVASATEGRSGFATYAYRTAKGPSEISISVVVLPSVGMAKSFYRETRADALSYPLQDRISLPRYGEQQFSDFGAAGTQLIVRTNRVVWVLGQRTIVKNHDLTKAEAIVEYKRYAPKQQRRVGKGK